MIIVRAVKTAVSDKIIQHFIMKYLHNPETRYMMWLHPRLPPRPLPDPPPPPRPCCCRCPRPPADRPLVDPLGAELAEVLQLVEVPEVVAVQVTQLIRLETERLRFNISVITSNSAFYSLEIWIEIVHDIELFLLVVIRVHLIKCQSWFLLIFWPEI